LQTLFPNSQAEELKKEIGSQDKQIEHLTEKLAALEAQVKPESKKIH